MVLFFLNSEWDVRGDLVYLYQRTARTALAEEEIMTTRDATKMKVVAVVEAGEAA